MGIDLATWRARIGLNYYHMCHPLQTRWRSSSGRLYQPGVVSWGVGEVMNDTPLVLKGCMTVVALSLILQYVVHSWSKLKGRGGGGKVRCHWLGATSQVRVMVDGGGTLLLRAIVVVIPLLLVIAGDVERNPGPVGNKLTPDDLGYVLEEVLDVSPQWYNLGLQLKLRSGTLDMIRTRFSDPKDQLLEMLKTWLTTNDNPCWRTLTDALRSQSVRATQLAADLETKYCPVEGTDVDIERTSLAPPAVERPTTVTARNSASTTPPPWKESDKPPFGCGCGKCTFLSFIENGCPTPIPSVSSFPYLNLSRLTHEQQQELSRWLQFESQQIMIRFQELVSAIIKSLIRRNVSCDKLVSYVNALGAFHPVFEEPQVPLFQYCFQGLEAADTIPKVFLVLNNYFSFFNYHIIEHIIKVLGTEKDKAKLQRYKEDFNQYAKRRIFESLPVFGPISDVHYADIFVIVDSQYENYTVAEIEVFRHKLSEILHVLSQGVLRICRVEKCGFHAPRMGSADKLKLDIDTSGTAENQRQFDKAMQYGHVEAWLSKMLLYGAAGSGKTCTKEMLAGNPPPEQRHSTPVAVRPVTVYRVSVQGKECTVLTTQQERKSFLARMLLTFVPAIENQLRATQQETQTTLSSFKVPSKEPNASLLVEQSQQQPSSDETTDREPESSFEDGAHYSKVAKMLESITTDKELVELMRQLSNTTDPLTSIRILHIIDSGGQPQFHEILPIFLRQLSFYVFVFRLDNALDSRPEVQLYVDGEQVGIPYKSSQTIEQLLQHCIRTMHSHGASSGCHPQIIVIGTHSDKMSKSELQEVLKQTNEKILKILLSSLLREQIVYSNSTQNEVVFPVNAADPGSWEEDIVEQIREIVVGNKSTIKSAKIPLKWFGLEVLLQEMAQTQGVLSKTECLAAAKDKLFFEEDSFNAAIEYLDKLSVLFHYPDILPDLVFADPQLLLDKLMELVVKAYEIQKQPKALTAKWKYFREFARVDVEFLSQEEFIMHYVPKLFEPQHLVHLFKELFIFASIGETELFVPCLLQSLDDDKVNEYRVQPYDSSPIPPLVIQFPEGCPRKGVFCSLICFLTSPKNYPSPWSILLERGVSSPVCLYRNCIQFKVYACPGTVTLIDAYTHFEIHTKVKPATSGNICRYLCQKIYSTILTGIHKASINLGYYNSILPPDVLYPTFALLCPCGMSSVHICDINNELSIWVCSIDNESSEELTPQQKLWIDCQKEKGDKGDDSVAPPSKRQKRDTPDITASDKPSMCILLKFPGRRGTISIPEQIGKNYENFGTFLLKDDSGTIIPGIESEKMHNVTDINRTILRNWIGGKGKEPYTWDTLVKCLRDADLNGLANDIEEVLCYDSSHEMDTGKT